MIENDASGLNNDGRQSRRPLITISIRVLDEADNIDSLYQRLCRLGETMAERCDLEFVFSDNHSQDLTWAKLSQLASTDPRVRAIRFSKNVGFQRSILANFLHSRGDAVLQIDADLQDPPELLSEFFELWRSGYRVVYGIRKMRPEGPLLRWFRRFGYWFIDKVSEHPIPRDVGDFRLIDRTVVNALIKMNSPSPYLRGMIASLGFSQTGIPYNRDARVHGKSKFNVARITQLGVTAVVNHSVVPLRIDFRHRFTILSSGNYRRIFASYLSDPARRTVGYGRADPEFSSRGNPVMMGSYVEMTESRMRAKGENR